MIGRGAALVAALAVLAGCAATRPAGDPLRPPGATAPAPAPRLAGNTALEARAAAAARAAPHIYMALQPDRAGPLSIVFAIDAARDNTPTDDPAIRLTPENGKCNPQELRHYDFPPDTARRPIFGSAEAAAGVTARDLPSFMAMAVTSEMLRRGMITEPDQSQPQNVCTRKLWERMIVNESLRAG